MILTPKEKARELRDKMYLQIPSIYDPKGKPHYPIAKKMALITVNEILKSKPEFPYLKDIGYEIKGTLNIILTPEQYWNEVELEIIKL